MWLVDIQVQWFPLPSRAFVHDYVAGKESLTHSIIYSFVSYTYVNIIVFASKSSVRQHYLSHNIILGLGGRRLRDSNP